MTNPWLAIVLILVVLVVLICIKKGGDIMAKTKAPEFAGMAIIGGKLFGINWGKFSEKSVGDVTLSDGTTRNMIPKSKVFAYDAKQLASYNKNLETIEGAQQANFVLSGKFKSAF